MLVLRDNIFPLLPLLRSLSAAALLVLLYSLLLSWLTPACSSRPTPLLRVAPALLAPLSRAVLSPASAACLLAHLSAVCRLPSLPLAAIGSELLLLSLPALCSPLSLASCTGDLSEDAFQKEKRMDSTPHCSRVVPQPSTKRAQTALTSVFG